MADMPDFDIASDSYPGKFHKFDTKIINFLKIWRAISRLILDIECSFNHQNDRCNVENTFTGLNFMSKHFN